MTNKVVALIPARKGSKSIPGKNHKVIAGKPLIMWVLESACRSDLVDELYVSTDDEQIRAIVESSGLRAKVIDRDPETATDDATTESVMLDFADRVDFDVLVVLQATSPLTRPEDIENALTMLISTGADSVVSCVETKRFFWHGVNHAEWPTPVNYHPANRPRRQNFPGCFMENGAIYVTPISTLMKYRCRMGVKTAIVEMDPRSGVELDEPLDWEIVERFLNAKLGQGK